MTTAWRRWIPGTLLLGGLVAGFVLGGCAGSSGGSSSPAATGSDWEVRVESPLDTVEVTPGQVDTTTSASRFSAPDSAAAPKEVTPPGTSAGGIPNDSAGGAEATESGGNAATSAPSPRQFTPGWRVQIAALSSMEAAEEVADRARRQFTEPVYVEYEPPLYKVRVGDFLLREPAEALLTRARAQGYEKAWVAETLVVKPGP